MQQNSIHSGKYYFDSSLDPMQRKAAEHLYGPIRVIAPAGGGKTKTLINRIVHLVNSGIDQASILALAFNKKAGEEMTMRLRKIGIDSVTVKTLHAFGYQILRTEFGWKFREEDQRQHTATLLCQAVRDAAGEDISGDQRAVTTLADFAGKTMAELTDVRDISFHIKGKKYFFKPVFDRFLQLKSAEKILTFDDMIYFALHELQNDENIRQKHQRQYEFLLVDEFQDLNNAQLAFVQILAAPQNNLFIVGDDDQMIYGWRGASVRHLLEFPNQFPGAALCTLQTNYRSSKAVITHAGRLISHNVQRIAKTIVPGPDAETGSVLIQKGRTLLEEAERAAEWIMEKKKIDGFRWSDFAVLYRYHALQFPLAAVFSRVGIPHTQVRLDLLSGSKVLQDILALLRIAAGTAQPTADDYVILFRIAKLRIHRSVISGIHDPLTFLSMERIARSAKEKEISGKFIAKINAVKIEIESKKAAMHLVQNILEKAFDLHEYYSAKKTKNKDIEEARDLTVYEVLLNLMKTDSVSAADFYNRWSGIENSTTKKMDQDIDDLMDEVSFTTIHRTKGNEYTNVVFYHPEDGSDDDLSVLEEERRVAYVAITRAKRDVLLTVPFRSLNRCAAEALLMPELQMRRTAVLRCEYYLIRIITAFMNIIPKTEKASANSDICSKRAILRARGSVLREELRCRKMLGGTLKYLEKRKLKKS